MTRSLLLAALAIAAAACTGAPATSPAPAAPAQTPPAVERTPSPAPAAPSPTETGDGSGLRSGSATVTLGDRVYQLTTGEPPMCMLSVGVQVGMNSEDRKTSLTVHSLGDLNATNFALITDDDRWVPAEGSPRFQVAGSQATWSGTLVGQHTARQEPGAIEVTCGG